jgi:capsular polysaccharide biosynthesis protein
MIGDVALTRSGPGWLAKVRRDVRRGLSALLERRIPYRLARRIAGLPEAHWVWRVTHTLARRLLRVRRLCGVYPLPIQVTPYTNFEYRPFAPVRLFPLAECPKSASGAAAWPRWSSELPEPLRDAALASCHTVLVPGGSADAAGNVFSREGRLVIGASLTVRRHRHEYYVPSRLFPAIYTGGRVAVLTCSRQDNYYHWLSDVLPRLHMVRSQGLLPDRWYVWRQKAFQAETLSLLGVPGAAIVDATAFALVDAETLIVPFHEIKFQFEFPQWVYEFLRASFLPAAGPRDGPPVRRIYVSRAGARWRSVVNEAEVLACLEPLGFRRVSLEGMSFLDQVTLFRDAEVVVGPHDAGLTNLVFAPPGTTLIELQPKKLQNPFFKLSRTAGLDYYYVTSSTGPANPVNNRQPITIDVGELARTIELAGIA